MQAQQVANMLSGVSCEYIQVKWVTEQLTWDQACGTTGLWAAPAHCWPAVEKHEF